MFTWGLCWLISNPTIIDKSYSLPAWLRMVKSALCTSWPVSSEWNPTADSCLQLWFIRRKPTILNSYNLGANPLSIWNPFAFRPYSQPTVLHYLRVTSPSLVHVFSFVLFLYSILFHLCLTWIFNSFFLNRNKQNHYFTSTYTVTIMFSVVGSSLCMTQLNERYVHAGKI